VAKGFRTPTLKELYMNWDHNGMFWIIGNEKLKPEQSIFYSLSTDYVNSEKKVNITGIVSYNQVDQKIGGVWSDNQTRFLYYNMKSYGIFTAELLGKWKVSPSFLLKAGYSFTHLYYDDLEVKPSDSSPHSVTAQVEYGLTHGDNRLVVNLSGKVVGAKKLSVIDENINQFYNVSYPAYQQWNLNVSNTYAERYTFSFGVKNIFDYTSPIVTFNTSTSVGRRFFLLVGYKF
jgi:outer membrane receptor for ferrienterochelin and colicins